MAELESDLRAYLLVIADAEDDAVLLAAQKWWDVARVGDCRLSDRIPGDLLQTLRADGIQNGEGDGLMYFRALVAAELRGDRPAEFLTRKARLEGNVTA